MATMHDDSGAAERRRRIEEEKARRRAEAQQRAAERQAQEQARAAEKAAQEASQSAEPAQQTEQPAQHPNQLDQTPEATRQQESVYATPEEKAQAQGLRRTIQEYSKGVKTDVAEYGDVDLPDGQEHIEEQINKANRAGELPKGGTFGVTNQVYVDYKSIKDVRQAAFYGMNVPEEDREQYLREYAEATGQDYKAVLSQAEAITGDQFFSAPKSDAGKVRAANRALESVHLLDMSGNALDLANAVPEEVIRALRMDPNAKTHETAYAAIKLLAQTPGSAWYGMDVSNKDMFAFMDSADLTKKQYDDEVDAFNTAFTFGESDDNVSAYYDAADYIASEYGDRPRVMAQMMAALDGSYSERTGVKPPPASMKDAFFAAQEAAEIDPEGAGEAKKSWWDAARKTVSGWFGGKEDDDAKATLDAISAETEYFDGKVTVDEAGNATFHGVTDVSIGTATTGADAGTVTGVGGLTASRRDGMLASAGGGILPPRGNAQQIDGFTDPLGMADKLGKAQGPQLPTAVDQMIAADAPSTVTDENARVPYDPQMTDADAMLAYMAGKALDPRNRKQIEPWITDKAKRDMINAVMYGHGVHDTGDGVDPNAEYGLSTVSWYNAYGGYLGAAMDQLSTVRDPKLRMSGAMAIADVKTAVGGYISDSESGYYAEANKHPYDAAIKQNPDLDAQMAELTSTIGALISVKAEPIKQEREDREKISAAYRKAISEGNGTPEMMAWLAYEEQDAATFEGNIDAMFEDEGYGEWYSALGKNSAFWKDGTGTYWIGGSAAAIVASNIKESGGSKKEYGQFKNLLTEQTRDLLWEFNQDAHISGMSMRAYLARAGIESPEQVVDMAFNQMLRTGAYVINNPDVQKAIETISIGGWNAFGLGVEYGGIKAAEGFAEGVQVVTDDFMHDSNVFDVWQEFEAQYGEMGREECRKAVIAYANSGELSEESKAELMQKLSTTNDVYGVAADYIGIEGVQKWLHEGVNATQEKLENIAAIRSFLPEKEQNILDGTSAFANSVVINAIGAGAGMVLGPVGGAAVMSFGSFADDYEYYYYNKNAGEETAMLMASVNMLGRTYINAGGIGNILDDIADGRAYTKGLTRALRKNPANGGRSLLTAAGYTLAHVGANAAGESVEGIAEALYTSGTEIGFDVYMAEKQALERGEGLSLSRPLGNILSAIDAIDPAEAGKELFETGLTEGLMGGVFSLFGVAWRAPLAMNATGKLRQYKSIKMAMDMYDGKVAMTETAVGAFVNQMKSDMQDPRFVKYLDRTYLAAVEQKNAMSAILDGVGATELNAAAQTSADAKAMQDKADAARTAADEGQAAYFDLCDQVAAGDTSQIPAMEAAQTTWQRAETAYNETSGAAKKMLQTAEEKTGEFLRLVSDAASGVNANRIRTKLENANAYLSEAARILQAHYDAQADADTQAAAQAEEEAAAAEAMQTETVQAEADAAEDAEVEGLTDEEIDAQISAIAEEEGRVGDARAEQDAMGYDEETLAALEEQVGNDAKTREARKNAIIRNQRNAYASLTARMEQAAELGDEDARAELGKERDVIAGRLESLGANPEENAPEPITDTTPERPVTASAPKAETAKAENAPEPTTTTKPAKPAYNTPERKAARKEQVADIATGTTKAEREAAAAAKQMNDNVSAMDAETFIEENFKDAPEEQKVSIREAWNRIADSTPMKVTRDIVQFASRVQKKFGVVIEFVDSLDGVRRGEITGNNIKIARDATTGDVVRSVILHELTHKAEGGGKLYDKLSGMILDMKYKGDQSAMDADIAQKVADYSAYYRAQSRTDAFTETEAKQEIVADYFGEMLSGNEKMIDRLVRDDYTLAQKIRNLIYDVLDKFTGVKDPQIEQMKKVVKAFDKAISRAGDTDGKTKYALSEYGLSSLNTDLAANIRSRGQAIIESHDDLRNHVNAALTSKEQKTAFVGGITENTKAMLERETGVKIFRDLEYAFGVSYDCIRHIRKHFKTAEEITTAVETLFSLVTDHDSVDTFVRKDGGYGLIFKKDDSFIEVEAVADTSKRTRSVTMKTAYISRKHQKGATINHADTFQSRGALHVDDNSTDIISENAPADKKKFSLPSQNALDAQIRAWMQAHQAEIDAAKDNDGVSQQPDTTNRNPSIPDVIKQELDTNPIFRTYRTDSNDAQFSRAMDNVKKNGYQEEVERLLDADHYTTDDSVEAGALAIAAFESGDIATGLSLMARDTVAVREAARTMQARQMFAKLSPSHVMAKIGGEMEVKLTDLEQKYGSMAEDVKRIARENDLKLSSLRGGDELARLSRQGSFTAPDNKWHVPINEKQQRLIDLYKLNNVPRPGDNYNRASVKQRMLEAILATPDPDADTGNGHTLTERLEWMKKGKAVATAADLRYIADMIADYVKYSAADQESREAKIALARALEAYGNITQLTAAQKIRTQRFVNMLLSVPSALRNVIGNSAMNAVNAGTHDTLGVVTDAITSLFTGKRTTAMISMKERADGWDAFRKEVTDTFRDYFVDKADTSVLNSGNTKFDQRTRGRAFNSPLLEAGRIAEGFLMSVGDRNFWKKAYFNSLAEQSRVAEMNGAALDWDAAVEQARADADYATFNEDSKVRDLLNQARQIPGIGFVMDMIMPFTGVPTNITKRMVEYSPVGLAWSFAKHAYLTKVAGQSFDQKSFVNGVSRGLSGTILFGIGMGLKELGLISLGTGEEDDEKIYNLGAAQGKQYSPYIRIGDEYISLAALAPAISPIIMGATAQDSLRGDDDKLTALKNAVVAAGDQIFDASYMSGLSDLFDSNGSFFENAANALAKNAVSQNMPYNALLNQIATAMDPYVRDTKDSDYIIQAVKSGAIAKIPGLREQLLNPKYDVYGNPVVSKEGFRNFLDPFTTSKANDDPVLTELERLAAANGSSSGLPTYLVKTSGKQTILAHIADDNRVDMDRGAGENKIVLNADQRNHYNKMYGDLLMNGTGRTKYRKIGKVKTSFEGFRDVMASRKYQRASDEEKAKMLAEVLTNAKALTQAQMVIDLGYVR